MSQVNDRQVDMIIKFTVLFCKYDVSFIKQSINKKSIFVAGGIYC